MDVASEMSGFLEQVETALAAGLVDDRKAAGDRDDILREASRHLCLGGGKRARPTLVRLFAGAVDAPEEGLVEIACAAEMIHAASLLHDDVVDGGMFRRSKPTVNARWGNVVAVLGGDLLLTTAFGKLGKLDPHLTPAAIELVAEMTRAAVVEVESREDLSLTLPQIRYIHEGKTGSLFGWCGVAAAQRAGRPEAGRRFDAFGRHLGVAFQIADDIRDITGTDPGKPQYADLLARSPSVPIILAVSKDDDLRRRLRDAWAFASMSPERTAQLGGEILALGVVEDSLSMMDTEIAAAIDALGEFAEKSEGVQLIAWAHMLRDGIRELLGTRA